MEGWGLAGRFIGVEVNGCAQIPDVSSPSVPLWKKSSLVFVRPRTKASVKKFCATLELRPV